MEGIVHHFKQEIFLLFKKNHMLCTKHTQQSNTIYKCIILINQRAITVHDSLYLSLCICLIVPHCISLSSAPAAGIPNVHDGSMMTELQVLGCQTNNALHLQAKKVSESKMQVP